MIHVVLQMKCSELWSSVNRRLKNSLKLLNERKGLKTTKNDNEAVLNMSTSVNLNTLENAYII